MEKKGRLRGKSANINQITLMNFLPTRPIAEIAQEYVDGFMQFYNPIKFLDRTYRHYRILGTAPCHAERRRKRQSKPQGKPQGKSIDWLMVKALLIIVWRQGVVRKTRVKFWVYLWEMFKHNRGGISSYLGVCAQIEHFLEYREVVKANIEEQLGAFLAAEAQYQEAQAQAERVEAIAS